MIETSSIITGTIDEIVEHLEETHDEIKIVGKNTKDLKGQLIEILETCALMEQAAMGMLFFFGKTTTNKGGIPTVINSLERQFVFVLSDAERARRIKTDKIFRENSK